MNGPWKFSSGARTLYKIIRSLSFFPLSFFPPAGCAFSPLRTGRPCRPHLPSRRSLEQSGSNSRNGGRTRGRTRRRGSRLMFHVAKITRAGRSIFRASHFDQFRGRSAGRTFHTPMARSRPKGTRYSTKGPFSVRDRRCPNREETRRSAVVLVRRFRIFSLR